MKLKSRTCSGCKNIFDIHKEKLVYGVFDWKGVNNFKVIVMCKKCILKDQKEFPEEWAYSKMIWDSYFSDVEKIFFVSCIDTKLYKENNFDYEKMPNFVWDKINIIHQWLIMSSISKQGMPVRSNATKSSEIHTFIHCEKCVGEKIPPEIEFGWTTSGLSVKCMTHHIELAYALLPLEESHKLVSKRCQSPHHEEFKK